MKTNSILLVVMLLFVTNVFSQIQTEKIIGDNYRVRNLNKTDLLKPNVEDLSNKDVENNFFIWNEEEALTTNMVGNAKHCRIVSKNGTTHVFYSDVVGGMWSAPAIWYSKKEDSQEDWTTPIIISNASWIGTSNVYRPVATIADNGNIYVFFDVSFDLEKHDMGFTYYNASEEQWSEPEFLFEFCPSGSTVWDVPIEVALTEDNLPIVFWTASKTGNYKTEVYMKYFNGTDWSEGISVSDDEDDAKAFNCQITETQDNKTMIVYEEYFALKYRIYDKITHSLSDIQIVPEAVRTDVYMGAFSFSMANKNNGDILIAVYNQGDNINEVCMDTIKCINYNVENNEFTNFPHKFISKKNHKYLFNKYIRTAIDSKGNCIITYFDEYTKNISTIKFEEETGFGNPQRFNETNEFYYGDVASLSFDAQFDSNDNIHVAWADMRNSDPNGWVILNIYYQKGIKNIFMPAIISEPVDEELCVNETAQFSITAEDANEYQWRVSDDTGESWSNISDNSTYSGTTSNTLTVVTEQNLNNNLYACVATNEFGHSTSKSALLTIYSEPVINQQPINIETSLGEEVVFSVDAIGGNLTYQWKFEDQELLGENQATLTILEVEPEDVGNYYVVINSDCGEIISQTVTLSITTDINEYEKYGIEIYPNPATDFININVPQNTEVREVTITNVTGQTISKTNINQHNTKIYFNVKSGLYFINMKINNKFVTLPIIIN